jgi:hypothetical protein
LAKILGAFKVVKFDTTTMTKEKRYFLVMENLNFGLDDNDPDIVRYDLKGSENKRYIT